MQPHDDDRLPTIGKAVNGHERRSWKEIVGSAEPVEFTATPLTLRKRGEEPPKPRFLVRGLFERKSANLLAADTGALKSWMAADLVRAVATRTAWLGREVTAERVLYIDEEMSSDMALDRLHALGVVSGHEHAVRYYSRQGFQLGDADGASERWLWGEAESFKPDLIIIDSAMAATVVDANDNTAIIQELYGRLRPLAEAHNLATLTIHHERKQSAGNVRTGGHGIMGGRQFVGQGDTVLSAVKREEGGLEEHPEREDRLLVRTSIQLEYVKVRRGRKPADDLVTLSSEMDDDYRTWNAGLVNEGAAETKLDQLVQQIAEVLQKVSGEVEKAAIAARLDLDVDNRTFERALTKGVKSGALRRVRTGVYALGEGAEEPL